MVTSSHHCSSAGRPCGPSTSCPVRIRIRDDVLHLLPSVSPHASRASQEISPQSLQTIPVLDRWRRHSAATLLDRKLYIYAVSSQVVGSRSHCPELSDQTFVQWPIILLHLPGGLIFSGRLDRVRLCQSHLLDYHVRVPLIGFILPALCGDTDDSVQDARLLRLS